MEDHSISSFDFIIITGDLAYFGKNVDYTDVASLLDDILDYTNTPKERLFIVPGNHDVDRNIVEQQKHQLKTDWKSEDDAVNFLNGDKTILEGFFKKFKGYSDFIDNYFGGNRVFTPTLNFSTHYLEIEGTKVALIGLNSCLKSGEDGEEGKLMITQDQLDKALYNFTKKGDLKCDLDDIPIKICFFHHPLEFIEKNESKKDKVIILQNFDFLLNGHIHDSAYYILNSKGNYEIITIIAGSTFIRNPGRGKQCYNIIKIDSKNLEGYGYFRKFEEGAHYWAIDTSVCQGTGTVEVKLR